MSAGTPWRRSNAQLQLRAPAPPVSIRVPSMSNRPPSSSVSLASSSFADRSPRLISGGRRVGPCPARLRAGPRTATGSFADEGPSEVPRTGCRSAFVIRRSGSPGHRGRVHPSRQRTAGSLHVAPTCRLGSSTRSAHSCARDHSVRRPRHADTAPSLPERPHRSVRSVLGSRGPARVMPVRKLRIGGGPSGGCAGPAGAAGPRWCRGLSRSRRDASAR